MRWGVYGGVMEEPLGSTLVLRRDLSAARRQEKESRDMPVNKSQSIVTLTGVRDGIRN